MKKVKNENIRKKCCLIPTSMKIYIVRFLIPTIFLNQIWANSDTFTDSFIQYSFCCWIKRLTIFYLLVLIISTNFNKRIWFHINIFRFWKSLNTTKKRRRWEKLRTIKMLLSFMNHYCTVLFVPNYVSYPLFLIVLPWSFNIFTSFYLWFVRWTELIFYFLLFGLFQSFQIIKSWSR